MRCIALCLLAAVSLNASADEFVQMSNGMTCWRNANGELWGCSGGVNTGDSGFNDTRSGQRYEYINPSQAIDTATGQPFRAQRPAQEPRRGSSSTWDDDE